MKNKIIKTLRNEIKSLEAIYIFGSYTQGGFNENSDLDIAFLAKKRVDSLKRFKLANKIANAVGKEVDLIDLTIDDIVLKYEIIAKGERIYQKDINEILLFESAVFMEYFDFLIKTEKIKEQILKDKRVLG